LSRGVSRLRQLQRVAEIEMPRACLVASHVCGNSGGSLKSRCHELVSWSLTLAATLAHRCIRDATSLSRGVSRLRQLRRVAEIEMPRACLVESHVCGYS